jgi:hypothetical protein
MHGNKFPGWFEPELPEDMPHDRTRHHDPEIVPEGQPVPDQSLGVPFVLVPRYDIMEIELVLPGPFQPPGEEVSGESQQISLRSPALDTFCSHQVSRPFLF